MEEVRCGKTELKESRAEKRRQAQELTKHTSAEQAPMPTNLDLDIDHDWILVAISQLSNLEPLTIDVDKEPKTWREAQNSLDASKWEEANWEEIKSLRDIEVYCLIPQSSVPPEQKIQKGRPIFKIKRDKHGKPVRYKVHLVFKGYKQIYGKDYIKIRQPHLLHPWSHGIFFSILQL